MQYIRNRENYERGEGVCGNLLYYMLKSSALNMSVSNIKIFSCFLRQGYMKTICIIKRNIIRCWLLLDLIPK